MEIKEDADGRPTYTLQFAHKSTSNGVTCELDPAHDWLPRFVRVGRRYTVRVTRFARKGGRFFPDEGEITESTSNAERKSRFKVRTVSMNDGMTAEMFGSPAIPDGVVIFDRSTGRIRAKGGRAAREAFETRYGLLGHGTAETERLPPLVAAHDPERWPVELILLVASGAALCAAVVLRRKPG